jgi:FkbM family methyltransferase
METLWRSLLKRRKAEPATGQFALDRYQVRHVTAIQTTGQAIRIVTDPRLWAHAVELMPRAETEASDGPIVVRIGLEVESGHIEVGALDKSGTGFLAAARVGPGAHTVELEIPAVSRCRSISIRNASEGASAVRIASVSEQAGARAHVTVDGFDLSLPSGVSRRGFSDKNIFRDVRALAGEDAQHMFQVGAHHGGEVDLYLKCFPRARIHCFEPAPSAFALLSGKFAGNERVALHQMAMSDRAGSVEFFVNSVAETNSLYPFATDAQRYCKGVEQGAATHVRAGAVDDLVRDLEIDVLDVLNLDVQGAELAVLRGAEGLLRRKQIRVVIAELIFVPVYEGQAPSYTVQNFLGGHGYRLYDFYNFAYDDSGQLLWGDAVFLPEAG